MRPLFFTFIALAAGGMLSAPAAAQTQGKTPRTVISIGQDQKLMFAAAQEVLKRNFKEAEALYSQALAVNNRNIDAYLQRGTVRREMNDARGSADDASMALTLVNHALQSNNRDPDLYYQRGMALRLLNAFDEAIRDISTGIQLGGKSNWQSDIEAIRLEAKVAN